MNRLGPSQFFVKPENSSNPKFLWSKKYFRQKTNSLALDDSLKPNSLNPVETVYHWRDINVMSVCIQIHAQLTRNDAMKVGISIIVKVYEFVRFVPARQCQIYTYEHVLLPRRHHAINSIDIPPYKVPCSAFAIIIIIIIIIRDRPSDIEYRADERRFFVLTSNTHSHSRASV